MLALSAGLDSRPWLIAFMDRNEVMAGLLTLGAIGATLVALPTKRFGAALIIIATLMIDAITLGIEFRYFRKWEVVALVGACFVAGIAVLVSVDGRRAKLAMRILVTLGLSGILFLGVLGVLVDWPWF